jgi:hypothetical protein
MEPSYNELLLTAVVAVVGVLAEYARRWLQSRTTPLKYGAVFDIARTAVAGVEEASRKMGLSSEDKFGMASEAVTAASRKLGLKLKPAEVGAFVNAAVDELRSVREALEDVE